VIILSHSSEHDSNTSSLPFASIVLDRVRRCYLTSIPGHVLDMVRDDLPPHVGVHLYQTPSRTDMSCPG
jgi:hypothetical protein